MLCIYFTVRYTTSYKLAETSQTSCTSRVSITTINQPSTKVAKYIILEIL